MSTPAATSLALQRIFVSDGHSYVGRHGLGSVPQTIREVDRIECVAGRGLRGDRYFDHKENFKGQVTLFSAEVFAEMCATLNLPQAGPAALRRNLLVSGGDLNELIGRRFELQGVLLEATEECRPCYWMDEALGPGAEAWLRGRGGLRCRILTDGWLHKTEAGIPLGQLTGAVLAGGQSRRMGRDKAGLIMEDHPLWHRQVAMLRATGAGVVGVVRQPGQPALDLPADVPLWHDAVTGVGPLAGVHAALAACPTEWLAVAATDMPRLDAGWFQWLGRFCSPGCGAMACHPDGSHEPLAAIYPKSALGEVTQRLDGPDFSLQALARALLAQKKLARAPLSDTELWRVENWNTPDDTALSGTGPESAALA